MQLTARTLLLLQVHVYVSISAVEQLRLQLDVSSASSQVSVLCRHAVLGAFLHFYCRTCQTLVANHAGS